MSCGLKIDTSAPVSTINVQGCLVTFVSRVTKLLAVTFTVYTALAFRLKGEAVRVVGLSNQAYLVP